MMRTAVVIPDGEIRIGAPARAALARRWERWLADLYPPVAGTALAAVGSLARGDCVPGSDLDLVIIHNGQLSGEAISTVTEKMWYPIWDSGLGLDHAVRTPTEAAQVAEVDIKAAVGMLDIRWIAGDRALVDECASAIRERWRLGATRHLAALRESCEQRWERHGELAFLLEGDLKEARGGLRDFQVLRGMAYAQVTGTPNRQVRAAYERLLDVRAALHEHTRRGRDRLQLQDQETVAETLGLANQDALLQRIADDARTISYAGEVAWRAVDRWIAGRTPAARHRGLVTRRPLADGVVQQDGEVVLARGVDPGTDAVLPLRVAAAAATAGVPINTQTLNRLMSAPPLPTPWPEIARRTLSTLLGAGEGLVPVWEACDRYGLVARWLPEWARIRSLPQRNPVHLYTVDRHLVETAAAASAFVRQVSRPDLLLIAALLHDIGKGVGDDHSVSGARIVAEQAHQLGLAPADAATLVTLVRHHLLLPDTATRRDLDDPRTVRTIVDAVNGDPAVLDLLHALTRADAAATGPAAWSDWKASLVEELVRRTHAALAGVTPDWRPEPPGPELSALIAVATDAEPAVAVHGSRVTVVAPPRPGLLPAAAGALSLHHLEVVAADISVVDGVYVIELEAHPQFGSPPETSLLISDVRRAVRGQLAVAARLAGRGSAYRRPQLPSVPPAVVWFPPAGGDAIPAPSGKPMRTATIMELRTADSPSLLHRVTAALDTVGAPVERARISTLGGQVVDAFYLTGDYTGPARRSEVESAVLAAATVPEGR